jgi:hypothetical protein
MQSGLVYFAVFPCTAYGAIRVMVQGNQIGEAAGIGAYVALDTDKSKA